MVHSLVWWYGFYISMTKRATTVEALASVRGPHFNSIQFRINPTYHRTKCSDHHQSNRPPQHTAVWLYVLVSQQTEKKNHLVLSESACMCNPQYRICSTSQERGPRSWLRESEAFPLQVKQCRCNQTRNHKQMLSYMKYANFLYKKNQKDQYLTESVSDQCHLIKKKKFKNLKCFHQKSCQIYMLSSMLNSFIKVVLKYVLIKVIQVMYLLVFWI